MEKEFKESTDQFIKTLKSGLKVCEEGSSIDIDYKGKECKVQIELRVDETVSEITKKLLLLSISAWSQAAAVSYDDQDKINIHIKLTYNGEDSFTEINTLIADDIINQINFDEDE